MKRTRSHKFSLFNHQPKHNGWIELFQNLPDDISRIIGNHFLANKVNWIELFQCLPPDVSALVSDNFHQLGGQRGWKATHQQQMAPTHHSLKMLGERIRFFHGQFADHIGGRFFSFHQCKPRVVCQNYCRICTEKWKVSRRLFRMNDDDEISPECTHRFPDGTTGLIHERMEMRPNMSRIRYEDMMRPDSPNFVGLISYDSRR